MGKYNNLIKIKKTKSRSFHNCDKCGKIIEKGDIYYREYIDDRFLHTLGLKKYCKSCMVIWKGTN
jgi:NAD-dependent SIR2 family protein deacetylase